MVPLISTLRPMTLKLTLLLLFAFMAPGILTSQEGERRLLRGQVLYRNAFVPNEDVINTTSEKATITNDRGEFAIMVMAGDELVFTAINYQLEIVKITEAILENNRLVVEVNEKVTALEEVTVSPENQAKFIELQNEDFKEFEYETDQSTEIINIAQDETVRGMRDGLNFVNIFKLLFDSRNASGEAREPLKVSEVLRSVYEDDFFITDLHIPRDRIEEFLVYCDAQLPPQSLLRKDNEFQLIDFLVTQSESYLKVTNAED